MYNNKRSGYKKKYPVAKRNASVARAVRQELAKEVEKKYYIDQGAGAAVGTAWDYNGLIVPLTDAISQGTNAQQRVGNKIMPKSLTVRYKLQTPTTNSVTVRMVLFQWFEASVPTGADIINTAGSSSSPFQPSNVDNKSLFKILSDDLIYLNQVIAGVSYQQCGKIFVSGNRLRPISFVSGATTQKNGGIYCLFISDLAAGATNGLATVLSSLTYTDQ